MERRDQVLESKIRTPEWVGQVAVSNYHILTCQLDYHISSNNSYEPLSKSHMLTVV